METSEPGPGEASSRLRSHPAVWRTGPTPYRSYAFTCSICERRFYLRHAKVQPDGSLACERCDQTDGAYLWCRQCQRVYFRVAFVMVPTHPGLAQPAADGHYTPALHTLCRHCRAKGRPPTEHRRVCQHCGEAFTSKRRDAGYCSGRCRVAAHRERQAVDD